MVVFFSGTGNSRYCAQLLAARLDDELVDAFHFIRDGIAAELCSSRPWVFVAPTYGWQLPRIFADFLRSGRFTGSRKAYFVMTCGSETGNAGAPLRALCARKGFSYQGLLPVVMPENYVALFAVPEAAEAAKIVAAARPVLEAGIDALRREQPFPEPRVRVLDRLKTSLVNPLFYRFFVRTKPFFATEACVGCGKCAQVCPLRNIRLADGRPVWGDACTHCMACLCGCPATAIEYGKGSRGKPRYQCWEYREPAPAGEYWEGMWSRATAEGLRDYLQRSAADKPDFLRVFEAHGVRRVCDAACGFGAYSALLRANGYEVAGFDIAAGSLALARQLLAEIGADAEGYRQCDICHIDFADASFDAVVAHAVIDHLSPAQAPQAVAELLRIVRPGGLVYLSFDPLEADDLDEAHEVLADGSFLYHSEGRDGLLFRFYEEEDIRRLLDGRTLVYRGLSRRGEQERIIQKPA